MEVEVEVEPSNAHKGSTSGMYTSNKYTIILGLLYSLLLLLLFSLGNWNRQLRDFEAKKKVVSLKAGDRDPSMKEFIESLFSMYTY